MPDVTSAGSSAQQTIDALIGSDAQALSAQLALLRNRIFPPAAQKTLRRFSSGETASLVQISDSYLRQLALAGEGPVPEKTGGGRRSYTLEQIHELRSFLGTKKKPGPPGRKGGEHLQIIAVANFKGGSGKTTTTVHLTQYLAFRGFRVLALDLDPQASLSAMFGYQPELDIGENETLYAALRYDSQRRPLREVIRPSYIPGLDVVPANLELHEFEHDTPRLLAKAEGRKEALFFTRLSEALATVEAEYDVVVIDCPPQLGFLTLAALCAATGVLITVHPQMLDIASMCQFLLMTSDLLSVVREAGGSLEYDFLRYLVTRYEPQDGPQTQVVGFLRSLFGERVLTNPMVKSTAISDAGLTKQTLYEVGPQNFSRETYNRASEALDAVNGEVAQLMATAWGRTSR
ncbi:plasmid partitioning protein RepA [Teichococcus vastitatis]|uniref:Plasmid partitioning protein RepA n=1 Tax=Teichococcus vastitatis TaxID=2307076 RepID=A0ABS9W9V3_9PROT|nr:plasmid partitioning protein RepA [Pseudoroseomonas vastitatis]MCI0756082.1 plasmid partitioning protein RepA [Pseudoroseomonas vastitatis]